MNKCTKLNGIKIWKIPKMQSLNAANVKAFTVYGIIICKDKFECNLNTAESYAGTY